jgi:ribonuclease-3
MSAVVVFSTPSEIEARVVTALLDSHGIRARRSSGAPPEMLPMAVNPLGAWAIVVHEEEAEEARRVIESHREEAGARVVSLADEFEELEARVAYRFRDRGLLEQALTHRSRAVEDVSGGVDDNESMEFLGDAVLGLVIADMLFRQFPRHNEGQKSQIKAAVVSTPSLARHAEQLGLGAHLLLGRGEEKTGGRLKRALLADTYEALIAAIYLDGGLAPAAAFLGREFQAAILEAEQADVRGSDYKSALQERLQSAGRPLPEYRMAAQDGPDHRKTFHVEVAVGGDVLARGTGKAKKEAEQDAARQALERLPASGA